MQQSTDKWIFLGYFIIALMATLFLSPGWGFMDDFQNIQLAKQCSTGVITFKDLIHTDINDFGRFRPVNCFWIISAYLISKPLWIYVFILCVNFLILFLWGKIAQNIWQNSKEQQFLLYILPLFIFIFTPFWNMFMYLSVQEKFVFWFGTVSIWFFIAGMNQQSFGKIVWAIVFAILAMMGKETGVALLLAYVSFCIIDIVWYKKFPISRWVIIPLAIVTFIYISYIKGILGAYTTGYKNNLNIQDMIGTLWKIPLIIKAIGLFSVISLVESLIMRKTRSVLFILMPLLAIIYFVLLIPRGFSNYLLAPMAPFLIFSGYGLITGNQRISSVLNRWIYPVGLSATILVLCMIIIPRINKMADKPRVVEAIKVLNSISDQSCFFYPPPVHETAGALKAFSQANIIYTGNVKLQELERCEKSYILTHDESDEIELSQGIRVKKEVYRNSTWLIREIFREG